MIIVETLITAWFLTWFNIDTILVGAVNEVLGTSYSTNIYWLIAFGVGVIGTLISKK